jgi:hypothetical protein
MEELCWAQCFHPARLGKSFLCEIKQAAVKVRRTYKWKN